MTSPLGEGIKCTFSICVKYIEDPLCTGEG